MHDTTTGMIFLVSALEKLQILMYSGPNDFLHCNCPPLNPIDKPDSYRVFELTQKSCASLDALGLAFLALETIHDALDI